MSDDFRIWARENSRFLSPEELSTAFRDLQAVRNAAGWRRNVLYVAVVMLAFAALAWSALA